jgi:hypothetical protein
VKNPSFKMMDTGVSMLIPQPYEAFWTRIDDGVFNAYPPQGSAPMDGVPPCSVVCYDAVFTQSIPIPFTTTVSQTALVAANSRRAWLLIQNNSAIGAAGDVLPNLYVTYDGPVPAPTVLALTILPGSGLVLDRKVPLNAIYIRWGTFTNTSGTAVAGGVLHQGLYPVQ